MTNVPDPALQPGYAVGRYMIHDQIASGGMASVHFGRLLGPVGFSRTIAIKRLLPQYASDPEFVSMFLDEARLATRINHPNVAATIDVVAARGELLLVMEYVHGETLSRLLRAGRAEETQRVPHAIAVSIIIDTLYGLHAAHEAKSERGEPLGIVHRDVSPQNVMVGRDGIGRVLDFGIAKAASRMQTTEEGRVKGKLAYMAPEQLAQGKVDRRTDVFAASILLWEALTGTRLFSGDDPGSIIARVLTAPIDPPSKHDPTVPAALDAIVLRGLARGRLERFSTAEEMASALERAIVPARASAVGSWVAQTAEEALTRRGRRLAEIESATLSLGALGGAATPPSNEAIAVVESQKTDATQLVGTPDLGELGAATKITELSSSASLGIKPEPRHRRRAWWGTLGGVATIGAIFALKGWTSHGGPSAPAAGGHEVPQPAVASAGPAPSSVASSAPSAMPEPGASVAPAVAAPPPVEHVHAPPPRKPRNCNPPYTFDADGVKHFKSGCL